MKGNTFISASITRYSKRSYSFSQKGNEDDKEKEEFSVCWEEHQSCASNMVTTNDMQLFPLKLTLMK